MHPVRFGFHYSDLFILHDLFYFQKKRIAITNQKVFYQQKPINIAISIEFAGEL